MTLPRLLVALTVAALGLAACLGAMVVNAAAPEQPAPCIGDAVLTPGASVNIRPSPIAQGTPSGGIRDTTPRPISGTVVVTSRPSQVWLALCDGGYVAAQYFVVTVRATPARTATASATRPAVTPTKLNLTDTPRPGCWIHARGVSHFIDAPCEFSVEQVP